MADDINLAGCRPKACCAAGTYACQVPMPLGGRVQSVDYCIADIVAALNAANLPTVASCCGHGDEGGADIALADGRRLRISGHTRFWSREDGGIVRAGRG